MSSEKQCSNCGWAHKSLLPWYFCKNPEEIKREKQRHNPVPQGGAAHSSNYYCRDWWSEEDE